MYLSGKLLIGKGIPLKHIFVHILQAGLPLSDHYAKQSNKTWEKKERFIETPATCTTCCTDQCSKDHTPWCNSVCHNCSWGKFLPRSLYKTGFLPNASNLTALPSAAVQFTCHDFWQFQYSCSSNFKLICVKVSFGHQISFNKGSFDKCKGSQFFKKLWWVLEVWVDLVQSFIQRIYLKASKSWLQPSSRQHARNGRPHCKFCRFCQHWMSQKCLKIRKPNKCSEMTSTKWQIPMDLHSSASKLTSFVCWLQLCASLPATNGVRKPEMPTMAPTSFPIKGHELLKSKSWSQTSHHHKTTTTTTSTKTTTATTKKCAPCNHTTMDDSLSLLFPARMIVFLAATWPLGQGPDWELAVLKINILP